MLRPKGVADDLFLTKLAAALAKGDALPPLWEEALTGGLRLLEDPLSGETEEGW